jgi:hypothetical protein
MCIDEDPTHHPFISVDDGMYSFHIEALSDDPSQSLTQFAFQTIQIFDGDITHGHM